MGRKNPQNGNGKKNGSRGTPQRHYGKIPRSGREPSGKDVDTSKWGLETEVATFADKVSQMTGGRPVETVVKEKPDGTTITTFLPLSEPVQPVIPKASAPAIEAKTPAVPEVPKKTRAQEFAEKAVGLICDRHGNGGFPVHLSYQANARKKVASALLSAYKAISGGIKMNYFPDNSLDVVLGSWPFGEQGVLRAISSEFEMLENEIVQEALLEGFLRNLPNYEQFHDGVLVGAIFRTFGQFGIKLTFTKIPAEIMADIRRAVAGGCIDEPTLSVIFEEIIDNYAVKQPEIISATTRAIAPVLT